MEHRINREGVYRKTNISGNTNGFSLVVLSARLFYAISSSQHDNKGSQIVDM